MKLSALILAAVFSTSVNAIAAEIAVLPVQGTNLDPGEIEAIGVLLANAYAAEAKTEVLGPVQYAAFLAKAGDGDAAAAPKMAETIEVTAVRLKTKISLRALRRGSDGAVIHSVEMTAASLDDMEQVAERLAKALVNRTTPEATRTIHNVTRTEGRAPNRTYSEKVMGLKTAFILPMARGLEFQPAMSLQFDGRFEGELGFLEFGIGLTLPTMTDDDKDSLGGLFAEFGGSYYLADANVSPYVGGGVIPRLYWGVGDGGVRAALYGQGGVMFMRESSTRLYTELRVAQNVLPYTSSGYDYITDQPKPKHDYYPTEVSLQVGIGW
ncbi:MAG: hypothetical protein HY903_24735 [Deltaproteobacteria bacterium]|nr:hypothetical protein [Deltaproteobacteria bacterium]